MPFSFARVAETGRGDFRRRNAVDRRDFRALALLAAATLAVFGYAWIRGRVLYFFDILFITGPFEDIFARYQRAGHLPIWVPEVQAGYPLLGAPHMNFFYPPHLVLRQFLPGLLELNLSLALHLFLAAAGMYAYLRALALPRHGALGGSLLFALGAHFTGRFGLLNIVLPLTWVPLLLLMIRRVWEVPTVWRAVSLAAVAALHVLAGSPQMPVLTSGIVAAALVSLLATKTPAPRPRHALRRLAVLGMAAFVTAGLLAASFVPIRAVLRHTDREAPLSQNELLEFGYPPWQVLAWVLPDVFGHLDQYFGSKNEPELSFSFGVTGFLLIMLIPFHWRFVPRELKVFLILLGAYGLAIAPGEHSPVYRFLVQHRIIEYFAQPARAMIAFHVGGAIAGGVIIATLGTLRPRRRVLGVLGAVILFTALLAFGATTLPTNLHAKVLTAAANSPWGILSPAAASCALALLLSPGAWRPWRTRGLLGLVVLELLLIGWWYSPSEPLVPLLRKPWALSFLGGPPPQPRVYERSNVLVAPLPDYQLFLWHPPSGTRSMQQSFVARQHGLSGVSVLFTKDKQELPTGALVFTLRDRSGNVVATDRHAYAALVEDRSVEFRFSPLRDSRDQTYSMEIRWDSQEGKRPAIFIFANPDADFEPGGVLVACTDRQCRRLGDAKENPHGMDLSFQLSYAPSGPYGNLRRQLLLPHIGASLGVETTRWAGALALLKQREYLRELGETHEGYSARYNPLPRQHRPLLDRYGIGYLLVSHPFHEGPLALEGIQRVAETAIEDRRVALYRNPAAYPRFHFAAKTYVATSGGDALDRLKGSIPFDRNAVTIQGDGLVGHAEESFDTSGSIVLRSYAPTEIVLDVVTPGEAFLVARDAYFPAWHAFIDETETRIFPTDYAFRGIRVPAGTHTVSFRFDTQPIRLGLTITGFTLIGIVTGLVARARRRRQSPA